MAENMAFTNYRHTSSTLVLSLGARNRVFLVDARKRAPWVTEERFLGLISSAALFRPTYTYGVLKTRKLVH